MDEILKYVDDYQITKPQRNYVTHAKRIHVLLWLSSLTIWICSLFMLSFDTISIFVRPFRVELVLDLFGNMTIVGDCIPLKRFHTGNQSNLMKAFGIYSELCNWLLDDVFTVISVDGAKDHVTRWDSMIATFCGVEGRLADTALSLISGGASSGYCQDYINVSYTYHVFMNTYWFVVILNILNVFMMFVFWYRPLKSIGVSINFTNLVSVASLALSTTIMYSQSQTAPFQELGQNMRESYERMMFQTTGYDAAQWIQVYYLLFMTLAQTLVTVAAAIALKGWKGHDSEQYIEKLSINAYEAECEVRKQGYDGLGLFLKEAEHKKWYLNERRTTA